MATTPRPKQHRHTQPFRARWGAKALTTEERQFLGLDVYVGHSRTLMQVTSLSERKGYVWATDGDTFVHLATGSYDVERALTLREAQRADVLRIVEVP